MTGLVPKQLSDHLKSPVSFKDAQIASLEDSLSREMDKRKEEKFIISLILILIGTGYALTAIPTQTGAIGIILLDIIVLMALGKFFDVRYIEEIIDKASDFWPKTKN